jgi:1,4-dihydroxy-6-naphthoate synthase
MKLSIGFSPCPNDTFIFEALVNKKIDSEGLEFEVMLEDVETLNEWVLQGKLDITKLSFPAFFQSLDKYTLLNTGSALGKGVGPLLISKYDPDSYRERSTEYEIDEKTIAIPGVNTTANLLLSFAFPDAKEKVPMIFSAIEDAVLTGKTDLGVIIHENRFTYQIKGLHKVIDLGEYWEKKMKVPVPLGGIAVKRTVDKLIGLKIDKLIRKSIEYAFANYPLMSDYVKQHSQTMSEEVMRQHIDLYVNDYSLELGNEGKQAIEKLFEIFFTMQHSQSAHLSSQLFLS